MFPQGGAAESPQDHVAINIVLGVLEGYVPEQTLIFPQKVIHLVPHLPILLYPIQFGSSSFSLTSVDVQV